MSVSSDPKPNNPKRRHGFKINVGQNMPVMQVKQVNPHLYIQAKPQVILTDAERNESLHKTLSKITDPDLVCDLDEKLGDAEDAKEFPRGRRAHQTTSLTRFMSNLSEAKSINDYFKEGRQCSTTMLNLESLINQLHRKRDSDKSPPNSGMSAGKPGLSQMNSIQQMKPQ